MNVDSRTRTRQIATPFLVSEQNKCFRGLGAIASTTSGGMFGSAGTVDSCCAADVGKYICKIGKRPDHDHLSNVVVLRVQ